MKSRSTAIPRLALLLLWLAFESAPGAAAGPTETGSTFQISGKRVLVKNFKSPPKIENEYLKRFKFDSAGNSKLKALRERYRLAEVIAPGKDEFEKQLLLMDWTHHRFQKFGRPSTNTQGALDILEAINGGHTFFCTQYSQLFASAAASLGWIDRVLALRRHQGASLNGTTEHSTTEIWSNQHAKWIMLDPTSNLHLEKDSVPLNAYEIRQEWFYNQGKNLVFIFGNERRKFRKADLPVVLKHFPGFGDLRFDPDELDKYGFIGYIPNTDLMDAGFDYGQMFITRDKLCDGTQWHKRTLPAHPATDPYFPIGQVELNLHPREHDISLDLHTLTPNFSHFEVKIDAGNWQKTEAASTWKLHPGINRLETRTLNQFGIAGPVSCAELELAQ